MSQVRTEPPSSHITVRTNPDLVHDVCGAPCARTELCVCDGVKPGETERTPEVLGGAMHDICMLVSEECSERLVNNAVFRLCLLFLFRLLPSHLLLYSFFSRSWGNMDYCIIMHYL